MYRYPAGWTCHHRNGNEQIDTTDEALAAAKMREGWMVLEIPSLAPILTAARDKIASCSYWGIYTAHDALLSTGATPLQIANVWAALRIASGQMGMTFWFANATRAESIALFNVAIAQQSGGTDADTMAVFHGSDRVG